MNVYAVSFPRFWASKGHVSRNMEVYLILNIKNYNHNISIEVEFLHSYNNIFKTKLNKSANTSNKIHKM